MVYVLSGDHSIRDVLAAALSIAECCVRSGAKWRDAKETLAFACNTDDQLSVAASAHIEFLRLAKLSDELKAVAAAVKWWKDKLIWRLDAV